METKRTQKKSGGTALAVADEQERSIAAMFGEPDTFRVPTDAPLPTIEILRESQQYRLPSGELSKSFEGHVLFWHEANVFWSHAFGEGDTSFPDCASSDGIAPDGGEDPLEGPCRGCPNNEYGSAIDSGRGKACQNLIRLYLILDGHRLPVILKAPPSSLGKKESLVKWLTNAINEGLGGRYQTIRARFGLRKKEFDKYTASVIEVETVRVLDAAKDANELQRLGKMFTEVQKYHGARVAADVAATDRHTGDGIPI